MRNRVGECPSATGYTAGNTFPSTPSPAQLSIANQRLIVAQSWDCLAAEYAARGEPLSYRQAAQQLGVAVKTLWTVVKLWRETGRDYNALIPPLHRCGRKSKLDHLRAAVGADTVEQIIAQVSGLKLDTESNTAAWRLYAKSDRCPESVAAVVLDPSKTSKHALPPSLRAATRLNKSLHDAHRGPRRLALRGMWTPRQVDILPGDIFSADDTTPIWGWWVPWEKSREYPHGVKLMQGQFLPVIDVASQACVAYVLIAREKSSYRAADIWALFGHTFDTVGLPRLGWQLERGSWEANQIAGVEVDYQDDEATLAQRVGGLRQLPTNITEWHRAKMGPAAAACFPRTLQTWTSYLPKSKSIEAWFNRSQTFEGTIYGALGRDQMRKPFEKAKKIFGACQRGTADPRLHFLSQTELVSRLRHMLDYLNHEPMEGEVFAGIPRQKFDAAVQEHPLFTLPIEQRWLYQRDWKVVTITDGWARVRLTHELTGQRYSLFYSNPGVFSRHEGDQVVVYYDRENFENPAQILLARTGDYLCEAQYFERRGSFLDGDRSGHEARSAWRQAVTSAYCTLVGHAPSRQVPAEIAARRAAAERLQAAGSAAESNPPSVRLPASASSPAELGAAPGHATRGGIDPASIPSDPTRAHVHPRVVASVPATAPVDTGRRHPFAPLPAEESIRRTARLAEAAEAARALRALAEQ